MKYSIILSILILLHGCSDLPMKPESNDQEVTTSTPNVLVYNQSSPCNCSYGFSISNAYDRYSMTVSVTNIGKKNLEYGFDLTVQITDSSGITSTHKGYVTSMKVGETVEASFFTSPYKPMYMQALSAIDDNGGDFSIILSNPLPIPFILD